jgi:hypothetical protein
MHMASTRSRFATSMPRVVTRTVRSASGLGPEPRAIPRAIAAALNDEEIFTVNGTEFDTRDG